MKLAALMEGQYYRCLAGTADVEVNHLTHDSRRSRPGSVFFCLRGKRFDGHDFAAEAVSRGAVAVIAERTPPSFLPSTAYLLVPDTRRALALAAAAYWNHPSSRLRVLAVTGTNGKTTVNHLVEAILRAGGASAGLIGTVENRIAGVAVPADLTTPDAHDIQAALAAMSGAGRTRACIEVSSHGLAGHRLTGCEIDVAILTNVARDHLDFHEDLAGYAATKFLLFRSLGGTLGSARGRTKAGQVYAVLNSDDSFFDDYRSKLTAPYISYGVLHPAHVKPSSAVLGPTGSTVRVSFDRFPRGLPAAAWLAPSEDWPQAATVRFPHPGRHNVRNVLAALSVAWAEGCPWETTLKAVETFQGVTGRWDVVAGPDGVTGIVDFAHNPGGLIQALETARLAARRRVILVFGCEGQKDRGKRPLMGAISARLADHVILTTDNTFRESGPQILADIRSGLERPLGARSPLAPPGHRATYEVIEDRREAIYQAVAMAEPGDLVVVAGRGHDVKLIFGTDVEILDDRAVLKEALARVHAARREAAGSLRIDNILTPIL